MKYLKKFEGKIINIEYKYDWCMPNNQIRIEIERTIKDILAELIEDGLYNYGIGWKADPCVRIFAPLKNWGISANARHPFDIDLVKPFADQIIAYLNSEGFKTDFETYTEANAVWITFINKEL